MDGCVVTSVATFSYIQLHSATFSYVPEAGTAMFCYVPETAAATFNYVPETRTATFNYFSYV